MGTSVNRASPSTPNWKLAKAVIGHNHMPVPQQCAELWKAAAKDQESNLFNDLQSKHLAFACEAASRHKNPVEAVREYDSSLQKDNAASLAIDMGKRALARAVANKSGSNGFAGELFSEVVSYYASRDLPSYVGSEQRISSASQAIELKNELRSVTKKIVGLNKDLSTNPSGWKKYVNEALDKLQKGLK